MKSQQSFDPERVRQQQRELWNSAAPGWKEMWSGFDRATHVVSQRLVELARIKPGHRVLDIATGLGEPALTAAHVVGPEGLVVATDQSSAMLGFARERADALGLTNIEFVEADAETLAIDRKGFDAVICRWGLMFVPDLAKAMRRIAEMLVAGGTFATAVWGPAARVPMISLGEEAIRQIAKLPPRQPDAPHPLRLADTKPLERAMSDAGFKHIEVESVMANFQFESAQAFMAQRQAMSASFRATLAQQAPEQRRQILDAIAEAAGRYADSSGTVRMENEAICIAAEL